MSGLILGNLIRILLYVLTTNLGCSTGFPNLRRKEASSDIKATSLESVTSTNSVSHWIYQSAFCPPGPNSILFCGFQLRWAFQWLRLCLCLLITVSIYLSNRQRPLAFLKWHSRTPRMPMHHHHVLRWSPAAGGGFLKSALLLQLPVSWLCRAITICKAPSGPYLVLLSECQYEKGSTSSRDWLLNSPLGKWGRGNEPFFYGCVEWWSEKRRQGVGGGTGIHSHQNENARGRGVCWLLCWLYLRKWIAPPQPPSTHTLLYSQPASTGSLAFWDNERASWRKLCTKKMFRHAL